MTEAILEAPVSDADYMTVEEERQAIAAAAAATGVNITPYILHNWRDGCPMRDGEPLDSIGKYRHRHHREQFRAIVELLMPLPDELPEEGMIWDELLIVGDQAAAGILSDAIRAGTLQVQRRKRFEKATNNWRVTHRTYVAKNPAKAMLKPLRDAQKLKRLATQPLLEGKYTWYPGPWLESEAARDVEIDGRKLNLFTPKYDLRSWLSRGRPYSFNSKQAKKLWAQHADGNWKLTWFLRGDRFIEVKKIQEAPAAKAKVARKRRPLSVFDPKVYATEEEATEHLGCTPREFRIWSMVPLHRTDRKNKRKKKDHGYRAPDDKLVVVVRGVWKTIDVNGYHRDVAHFRWDDLKKLDAWRKKWNEDAAAYPFVISDDSKDKGSWYRLGELAEELSGKLKGRRSVLEQRLKRPKPGGGSWRVKLVPGFKGIARAFVNAIHEDDKELLLADPPKMERDRTSGRYLPPPPPAPVEQSKSKRKRGNVGKPRAKDEQLRLARLTRWDKAHAAGVSMKRFAQDEKPPTTDKVIKRDVRWRAMRALRSQRNAGLRG